MPKIKKEIVLQGLECANCALNIENEVKSLVGVTGASVNFVTQKLTVEVTHESELERIIHQVSKIAVRIESGIKVIVVGEKAEHLPDDVDITKVKTIRLTIGAVLFALALILKLPVWTEFSIYFASYLLVGGDVLLKAGINISRGRVFDENFLMGVATIGAFAIKQFPEGVAVMLFYQVGMFFQSMAVNKSRKSISALMNIRPDYANLKTGEDVLRVSPYEVHVGNIIIIKPGEKIPLDGKIVNGSALLDTSIITGESIPRTSEIGDEVLSGMINTNGLLAVEVTKEFGESTVSRILDLVQNAHSKKAPTENFITKFARYYTPLVVIIAAGMAIIPPLVFQTETFSNWINRALVFLVVSCPCALVISIPLGFFGGIAGASKQGILIKGSSYLEALGNIDTVIFDKTGTLTKGVFNVTKIVSFIDENNENLLEYAAYAESHSSHPIANSIKRAYGRENRSKRYTRI